MSRCWRAAWDHGLYDPPSNAWHLRQPCSPPHRRRWNRATGPSPPAVVAPLRPPSSPSSISLFWLYRAGFSPTTASRLWSALALPSAPLSSPAVVAAAITAAGSGLFSPAVVIVASSSSPSETLALVRALSLPPIPALQPRFRRGRVVVGRHRRSSSPPPAWPMSLS